MHVWPDRDGIEHRLEDDCMCWCEPKIEVRDDGIKIVVHERSQ